MTRWRWTLVGALVGLLGSATLVAQSGIWISVNGGQSLTASTVNPVPAIAIQQNGTGPIFTLKKSDGTTVFEVAADGACTGCGGAGSLPTSVQGDLAYSTAADTWTALHKDTTATRYLSNTGTTNNPAWALVNVANGVTGDLPFANLAQCTALTVLGVTGNSTADNACIAAGSDDFVLRRSGTTLAFGTIATGGIANNAVTLAKLATIASHTLFANNTAGAAVPTAATLTATIDTDITSTDHNLLLRNASTWIGVTLPDCGDTGGNHLNYSTTSHTFGCGTSGGADGGVTVTGTPTAGHVAIWDSATAIEDGGVLPSFTPTGGIDELIYYAGSGDSLFHPLGLANGITLVAGNLGLGDLTLPTGKALRTATSAGNTLLLQAYDVNGTSYTTFGTLTANNTPTFDLDAAVTLGGVAITSLSNTQTFTNKTYNVEDTGNVFTIPMLYQFTAGNCQNTTASIAFDLPTTLGATATCQGAAAGGHAVMGTAKFVQSEVDEVQGHFKLPADWTGAIDVTLDWNAADNTGNDVVWQIKFGCAAVGEAPSTVSFNTTAFAAVTNLTTTLRLNVSTKTGITTTGCAASETAWFIIYRDIAATGDTLNQDVQLIDAIFTVRRAI